MSAERMEAEESEDNSAVFQLGSTQLKNDSAGVLGKADGVRMVSEGGKNGDVSETLGGHQLEEQITHATAGGVKKVALNFGRAEKELSDEDLAVVEGLHTKLEGKGVDLELSDVTPEMLVQLRAKSLEKKHGLTTVTRTGMSNLNQAA